MNTATVNIHACIFVVSSGMARSYIHSIFDFYFNLLYHKYFEYSISIISQCCNFVPLLSEHILLDALPTHQISVSPAYSKHSSTTVTSKMTQASLIFHCSQNTIASWSKQYCEHLLSSPSSFTKPSIWNKTFSLL